MFKHLKAVNLPLLKLQVDLATMPLASQTAENKSAEFLEAEKASKTPRPVLNAHYSLVNPSPPPDPVALLSLNKRLAQELGLDLSNILAQDDLAVLCGSKPVSSSSPSSWSYCYGGHQFGSWAGQLGDGRAISIAQIQSASSSPKLYELQLKGAGMTPYSRFADGLAVIRSSIREYLCAEAMHALQVPTSRSLSLVTTGQVVERERLERGAIVCRVATCWIRFGNFEIFYARDDIDNLKLLTDYVIDTHYPRELAKGNKYASFLEKVVQTTASMIAKWQTVGFCHGVMNTDNFSILGETIDYGPFQFLDAYDPTYICNHSDEMGRYSFMEQPNAALFNLIRFATALSPLLEKEIEGSPLSLTETIKPILDQYAITLRSVYQVEMCKKFGFVNLSLQDTRNIMETVVQPLLLLMHEAEMDYTIFMRTLSCMNLEQNQELSEPQWQLWVKCSYRPSLFAKDAKDELDLKIRLLNWFTVFRNAHLTITGGIKNDLERRVFMEAVNPKYILRNHVVQKVIEVVEEQVEGQVGGEAGALLVEKYLKVLQNPFVELEDGKDDAFFGGMVPLSQRNIKCSCSS